MHFDDFIYGNGMIMRQCIYYLFSGIYVQYCTMIPKGYNRFCKGIDGPTELHPLRSLKNPRIGFLFRVTMLKVVALLPLSYLSQV